MTKNLIFLMLMRLDMIPFDMQLIYTNIVFVNLLSESFKQMRYWHFLYVHSKFDLVPKNIYRNIPC